MVLKFVYGKPIETGAVVKPAEESKNQVYFKEEQNQSVLSFSYAMDSGDIVYGLGENVRGINKRGWIYESYCADDPMHTEDKRSLYGAHNFFIVSGKKCFGAFFDTPSRITFDIGYTDENELKVYTNEADLKLYIIEGKDEKEIVKQFRELIGTSYIPPLWGFGYQQSRWSYHNREAVENVFKKHRENNLPIDAIYLDIDYMDSFKDFTVNEKAFPDFKGLVDYMSKNGVHLVPIIDAGVKIEEGYEVYEQGVENNYFVKDKNGNDYVTAVWPGKTHFPDFLNSKARKWFGNKYKVLLDCGIDGFWNDMNEPAIFYSENGLETAWEKFDEYKGKPLDINSFFTVRDIFASASNSMLDYRAMYHNMDGEIVNHDKVHNMYGGNMTKSAAEAFEQLRPDKRILLFSRSSYIGSHRYGGIWQGDNQSWWSHLEMNIKMLPSLNMCGFLYTGADLGGFGGNATKELVLRWLALSVFTPIMRNHSALGTREQEAYSFGDCTVFKGIIALRYRLIPYLYSEFLKAALNNEMMISPLAFEYRDDERAKTTEDQLLVGESLMIAPVYKQNQRGRYVYLPERMMLVRFFDENNYETQIMEKGDYYIPVALNEVVFFIRENKLLPLCQSAQNTAELDRNSLQLLGFVTDKASYTLYDDDGISKNYNTSPAVITVNIHNEKANAEISGDKTVTMQDIKLI